jgi:hypothetical protein
MDDRTTLDRGPFLPTSTVAERYGTTPRGIKRWERDPDLGFPLALNINGYNYFSLPELIAWERSRATEVGSENYAKGVVKQQRNRAQSPQEATP